MCTPLKPDRPAYSYLTALLTNSKVMTDQSIPSLVNVAAGEIFRQFLEQQPKEAMKIVFGSKSNTVRRELHSAISKKKRRNLLSRLV